MVIGSTRARQSRLFGLLGAAFLIVVSCQDVAAPGHTLPFAFSVGLVGGPAEAFDRADRVAVQLLNGSSVVVDSVIPISAGGQDVQLSLRIPRELEGQRVTVSIELRRGQDPLFTGTAPNVRIGEQSVPVEITLAPVIARLEMPATTPTINAIGGSTQVRAAPVFATGDTVPGFTVTWSTLDPTIVSVTPDGTVRALAEGDGRVQGRAGSVTATVTVRVRAAVVSVTVTPSASTVRVDDAEIFAATARDANGNVLDRTASWSVADPAIASIDAAGKALGRNPGTTTVTASIEGVTGQAQLTVVPRAPTPPGNFTIQASGQSITLLWNDVATDEQTYEIWRGPADSTQMVRIVSLPAGSGRYTETMPIDTVLTYAVRACNPLGCGSSPATIARTVPRAPGRLDLIVTDYMNGRFTLYWEDHSKSETRFAIEIGDDSFNFTPYDHVGTDTTWYDVNLGYGSFALFQVLACNQAGCSPPSNWISVYFGGCEPPVVNSGVIRRRENEMCF